MPYIISMKSFSIFVLLSEYINQHSTGEFRTMSCMIDNIPSEGKVNFILYFIVLSIYRKTLGRFFHVFRYTLPMFLDIIPSEHSIGIHPLTYSIPEGFEGEIIPGCMVEIPVRNALEYGIVVGFRQAAPENMEIRDISRIITSKAVLAPYPIALILEISAKYLIPIHRVLGFFLSKAVVKRLEKKNYEQIVLVEPRSQVLNLENSVTILKDSVITWDMLRRYLKPWTVVLCQDDLTLYRLEKELWLQTNTLFLPSESTETKKSQWWIDIQSKKYDIIVWNRKILYYNLSAYTNIIYLEDAFGREYFHYPIRIEYIDIFDMLDRQQRFSLQILTSVPRLTTLSRFRHFHTEYL